MGGVEGHGRGGGEAEEGVLDRNGSRRVGPRHRAATLLPAAMRTDCSGMKTVLSGRAAPVLVFAIALLLLPGPTAGQGVRPPPVLERTTADPLADDVVDQLFFGGRPSEAFQRLELRIERDSTDVEARWRAARAALNLGIIEDREEVEEQWFVVAGDHGEAAAALRSDDPEVLYWAAASLGREALQHGPRTSTRLVQQVWDLTHRVLELDPDHAGAHNILGKLNQEVMSLSGFERFVGRLLFSIDPLKEANWDAALEHHARAVEADPETILFRRDYGETLAALDRHDEARAMWQAALVLPSVYPVDDRFKDDIRRMLAELP